MTDSGWLLDDAQPFEQPYRDLCAGLKKLENVVDYGSSTFSTTSASAFSILYAVWVCVGVDMAVAVGGTDLQ